MPHLITQHPDRKNGPAARSFAADAHDCIMVRIKRPYRIQVCGTKMRPQWRAPLGFSKIDRHRQTLKLCRKKAPVAGDHRSACSGVKALRTQATLGGKPPSFATVSV